MTAPGADGREQLVLLREQVAYLLERDQTREGQSAAGRPVNWNALDPPGAAEQLQDPRHWTLWLTARYDLTETVPACWPHHDPILEELSALRAAWHGAYTDPAARPFDGVGFHDALERTLARIREWDRAACARGQHRASSTVDRLAADASAGMPQFREDTYGGGAGGAS